MTYLPPSLQPKKHTISDPVFNTSYKGFKMAFLYDPLGNSKWIAKKTEADLCGIGASMSEAVDNWFWNNL